MKKSNKIFKYVVGSSLILIIGTVLLLAYNNRINSKNQNTIQYKPSDLNDSKEVIRNSFKYENEHDLINLKKIHSSRYENTDFRLDNLISTEILEVTLLDNEKNYKFYLSNGNGRTNNIKRENLIIYRVKYNIKYKDETIEPVKSGEYDQTFYLIKENNNGNWKIDAVGENYYK